jgi:HNH endonuclease
MTKKGTYARTDDPQVLRAAVNELFFYSEKTRGLERKEPRRVGTLHPGSGGRHVYCCGRKYEEHRLIWLMTYGSLPDGQIDHINGDRQDNRLSNLRLVSNLINQRNKGPGRTNDLGVRGINRVGKRFCVRINLHGVNRRLGSYGTFEQAVEVLNAQLRLAYGADAEFRIARNSPDRKRIPDHRDIPSDAWGISCGVL